MSDTAAEGEKKDNCITVRKYMLCKWLRELNQMKFPLI